MMNPTPKRTPRPRRAAFTLIEILVTISIIVLLVGISVPVAIKMLVATEASSTRTVLNGLAAAADDYNIVTQTVVPHQGKDAFGNDIDLSVGEPEPNTGPGPDVTFAYFIYTTGKVPTTAKLINIAAKENLRVEAVPGSGEFRAMVDIVADINRLGIDDSTAQLERIQLLDGWENQIRYAAGVNHTDAFKEDDYLPARPTAYFASAGPDGLWGSVERDTNQPDPDFDENEDGEPDAADNVYSFDLD